MLEIPLQLWQRVKSGPLWKSLFRHGYPDSRKNQSLAVFTNVFLHLHPVKVRRHALAIPYTWCMGGLSFFLFLVLTLTGTLLMFYYRPTTEWAYSDIKDLETVVIFGQLRIPDFDTSAGNFQIPVTARVEFSPSQKFDIGLEFTLLNIKPVMGSPIDNRFIALFIQSRFGK